MAATLPSLDQQHAVRELYKRLRPGDRIEVQQVVTVSPRSWTATTSGTVVAKERARHGLHFQRNFDDKVFSDVILLRKGDGELTTVALDEFTALVQISDP